MRKTSAEYKMLLGYGKRMGVLLDLLSEYRSEQKSLGRCIKLIKVERKNAAKSKSAIAPADLKEIVWRYDEIIKIALELKITSDPLLYDKANERLDALIDKVKCENDIYAVKATLSSAEIGQKISAGAEKVKTAVGDAVDKLKKTIKGENSG